MTVCLKGQLGGAGSLLGAPPTPLPEVREYNYSSNPLHYFRYSTRSDRSLQFGQDSPLGKTDVTILGRSVSNV